MKTYEIHISVDVDDEGFDVEDTLAQIEDVIYPWGPFTIDVVEE